MATSNSVTEILTKSPEIVSDEEGALSVFGKGATILYLNGKRMCNLILSLGKPFFDDTWQLSFIANDIFHGIIATGNYNVAQTDVYYNRRWSTDYFRLAVIYNFGRLKKANYKNRSTGESENDRVQ